MKDKAPKLSKQRKIFVDQYIKGVEMMKAYRKAGYKGGKKAAFAVLNAPAVKDYITYVNSQAAISVDFTRTRAIKVLATIAESRTARDSDKIKAVTSLAAMCGWNEPEKKDVKLSADDTLKALLKDLRQGKHEQQPSN